MVDMQDFLRLIHPILAVTIVFPILRMAVLTRDRRLQTQGEGKSKISPGVGQEHLKLGRWLATAVIGIELLGITRPMFKKILGEPPLWSTEPTKFVLILLMYVVAIGSLVVLYQARQKLWRGVFATLCGAAVVVLSLQDGIFRRDNGQQLFTGEWYISHFYYGVAATLLMIFSMAIIQDIYQDRTNRWRMVHVVLNSIAVLLFISQGVTGTRDLLEIPVAWQEPHLYQCDFGNKKCPEPAPQQ
jgi:Protein of unknown function (DUF4079)